MASQIKTVDRIRDDMIATIKAEAKDLTDFSRGSFNRAYVEAASLSDADIYIQVAKMRALFSIDNAKGADLDKRAKDYGETRLPPLQASGNIAFGDSRVTVKIASTLTALASIGATTVTIASSTGWPLTGSVILDRDVPGSREKKSFTRSGTTLTVSATTIAHANGAVAILSQQGSDNVATVGEVVLVPATEVSLAIQFTSLAAVTLLDGDVQSTAVQAQSVLTGAANNVAQGQIQGFSSLPWPTATVTNTTDFSGGQDLETDPAFRTRIKTKIQTLTAGTELSLETAALGVSDTVLGQRVVTAQLIEDNTNNRVLLYIDNGAGTASSTANQTTREVIIFDAAAGKQRGKVTHVPLVDGTINITKSVRQGDVLSMTPGSGTADIVDGAASFDGSETGKTYIDANRNAYAVASVPNSTTLRLTVPGAINPAATDAYAVMASTQLVEGTDYILNETTGDVELTVGLPLHGALTAEVVSGLAYTYFTGLIYDVQRVINGDKTDFTDFPGVKAKGVKVKVLAPTTSNISIIVTIVAAFGYTAESLVAAVVAAIAAYINGLGIGDDVILAEIVKVIMQVTGVADCKIVSPTTNIVTGDGVLPRTTVALITVAG